MNIEDFIKYLEDTKSSIIIEIEGKASHLRNFLGSSYDTSNSNIITLKDDANKWAAEARIYLNIDENLAPAELTKIVVVNHEIKHKGLLKRINNNNLVKSLIDKGYRPGFHSF